MSLPTPSAGGDIDPAALRALDAPLVELAQKSGGDLRKLMHAFFSFLNRRTDFYCVPHPDDLDEGHPIRMGFKEGDAEKLLLAAFRQFPLRRMPKGQAVGGVGTGVGGGAKTNKQQQPTKPRKGDQGRPSSEGDTTKPDPSKKKSEENPMDDIRRTEDGKQIPVGNGGATDTYRWTQTIEEATVVMAVPDGTRGKDLEVRIKPSNISVKFKNAPSDEETPQTILEGKLHCKIQADESTWSLEGGAMLLVLQKAKKTWWDCILEGDDKIDTELVDSRRRIDEYDSSTQGAIRRILFDQQQESLGKPTSAQILKAEGKANPIPALPAGVEYIDKAILDSATNTQK